MNVKRTVIGSAYRKPDDAGVPKKSDITVSTNDKNVIDVTESQIDITTVQGGSCNMKGGLFDFNTRPREGPVRFSQDVNKYDIQQDYRQKNSLKMEPYDVKTTKYLVERNTPTHQNIDNFIKQGQNKMNDVSNKRKKYYSMLTPEQRRRVYDNHEFTDIIRTKSFFKSEGFKIGIPKYLYSLIDYGNMCVYLYTFEDEDHTYRIITQFPNTKDQQTRDILNMKGFEQLKQLFTGKTQKLIDTISKSGNEHVWRPKTLNEFWNHTIVREAFLSGGEQDIVDRDSIIKVPNTLISILGCDPKQDIPPKGQLAMIYQQMEALDENGRVDGDKKNLPPGQVIQVQDPQNLEPKQEQN